MAKKTEGRISKSDAIRAAIADGIEKPSEGVAYVKEKFGLEITNQTFSTVKFQDSHKKGGAKKAPVARTARNGAAGTGNAAELAKAVKQLVERYGAEEVRGMVGVFAE